MKRQVGKMERDGFGVVFVLFFEGFGLGDMRGLVFQIVFRGCFCFFVCMRIEKVSWDWK